jgi:thiol-disulfide isomerase/thioredoxin
MRACSSAVVLAALAAGACASSTAPVKSDQPILNPSSTLVGRPMPDLASLRPLNVPAVPPLPGRVTVVEFGSSGCAGCKKLAPGIEKLRASRPDGAVQIVRVLDGRLDTEETARALAASETGTALVLDPDGSVFRAAGVTASPTVFVVGSDGRVAWCQPTTRIELIDEWVTDAVARSAR